MKIIISNKIYCRLIIKLIATNNNSNNKIKFNNNIFKWNLQIKIAAKIKN